MARFFVYREMNTSDWKINTKVWLILFALGIVIALFGMQRSRNHEGAASESKKISAAVVPHHDLVAGQRAEFMSKLKTQLGNTQPKTIILVSPNHYYLGQGKIQTTDQVWNLAEGTINPNKDLTTNLVANHLATNEPGSFVSEHGIYNILKDIHTDFPHSQLLPLILKDVSPEELQQLNNTLTRSCPDCLMLTSVDFSHYQPAKLAELHDEKTLRDLETLNISDVIKNAEVDSGSALALMIMWAQSHNTKHFDLEKRTDSDQILNTPDTEGTSHLYGWYETGDIVQPDQFTSFVVSPVEKYGDENRTIWGVDKTIISNDPLFKNTIVAGKITNKSLDFFALPFSPKDPAKLAKDEEKTMLISHLPLQAIESKIKVLINTK